MNETWKAIRLYIHEADRVEALVELIRIFQDNDWDGVSYLEDEFEEAREAIRIIYPNWDEEDE